MKFLFSIIVASLLLTGCSKSLSLDDQTKLLEYGNVLELMELQSKIDDEAQKIYIGKLIEDFTKMENPETYSEGTMSLVADLQLDKLRIVCPS